VPLEVLLLKLAGAYEEQLASNRLELGAAFDEFDTGQEGCIPASAFNTLILKRDRQISTSTLSTLRHKVHEASERIDAAVGDSLGREAYVVTLMRGAPGLVPSVMLRSDVLEDGGHAPQGGLVRRNSLSHAELTRGVNNFGSSLRTLRPTLSYWPGPPHDA